MNAVSVRLYGCEFFIVQRLRRLLITLVLALTLLEAETQPAQQTVGKRLSNTALVQLYRSPL